MSRPQLSRTLPRTLPLLLVVVAVAGCDAVQEQINDVATDALDSAIEQEANRRLDEAGVQLSTPVDCATDGEVSLDSLSGDIVTNCSATTVDDLPVTATFDGVVGTDNCDGALTIVVGSEQIYDGTISGADCAL